MDMPTTVRPSKRKQYNADRKHVLAGFERAIDWIRENTRSSIGAFSIDIDKKFGAKISLHPPQDTTDRNRWIKRLFSGKELTRTYKPYDCMAYYRVEDSQNQLAFTWNEFVSVDRPTDTVVEVTTI